MGTQAKYSTELTSTQSAAVAALADLSVGASPVMGASGIVATSGLVYAGTVTSLGGAVAGDIVRLVSAGNFAPARANLAANAACITGVYDGVHIVPLTGYRSIRWDAPPSVGAVGYLSADADGCGGHTQALGLREIGTVVLDQSVLTDYRALVACPALPQTDSVGLDRTLLIETAARLGGTPDNWTLSVWDDFGIMTQGGDGGDYRGAGKPLWGNRLPVTSWSKRRSAWYIPASANRDEFALDVGMDTTYLTTNVFRFSARWKGSASGEANVFIGLTSNIGLACGFTTEGSSDNTKLAVFGTAARVDYGGGHPSAGERTYVADRDGLWHTFDIECPGDATYRWRFDGGAWSSPISLPGDGGTTQLIVTRYGAGSDLEIDYIALLQPRPQNT